MIKIEKTDVCGFEAAIRGMRNPMNSWDKSDSFITTKDEVPCDDADGCCTTIYCNSGIGPNDLELMKKLVKAGSDHSKFMRMINVTVDITAPLYWWKEFDTYKVGVVRNSCSTMHKIAAKEFTLNDFSHEHLMCTVEEAGTELLDVNGEGTDILVTPKSLMNIIIGCLNNYRMMYLKTNDKSWWWQMIQLLPSSYNQRATVQLNYAVLRNMYRSRKNHKLDEWRTFCKWIESLPFAKELITVGDDE